MLFLLSVSKYFTLAHRQTAQNFISDIFYSCYLLFNAISTHAMLHNRFTFSLGKKYAIMCVYLVAHVYELLDAAKKLENLR